jgi:hypothetical protein
LIEIAIGMYRQSQEADLHRRSAAKIRRNLREFAKEFKKLYEQLSDFLDDRDAYMALTRPVSPDNSRRLSELLDALLWAPKWFLIAANRVKDLKRGPQTRNVYDLVAQLDGIREHFTGKKISRSYKDPASLQYIKYVCKIADPSIGDGTMDQAMRKRIKSKRNIVAEFHSTRQC